jgi:hypothetical protein
MIIPDTVAMKPAKTAIPVARHETSCKEATKMVQENNDFVQSVKCVHNNSIEEFLTPA